MRSTPALNQSVKIGITGLPGAGKSTVLRMLERRGFLVMDTTDVFQELLRQNRSLMEAVRKLLEKEYDIHQPSTELLRLMLPLMFYHQQWPFLQEQVLPSIRTDIKRFLYSPMGSLYRAVEDSLLVQTDTAHLYNEVWSVHIDLDVQQRRLLLHGDSTLMTNSLLQALTLNAGQPTDNGVTMESVPSVVQRRLENNSDIGSLDAQLVQLLEEIRHQRLVARHFM
ncbi:MAG: dephospho-CoA kinase [Candidatus Melainabacteria bacterium]|nr:dephospho-CoA kinase [Candidatus Melainabacteria bacterium]